jgi:uncharacterized membrane protein
MNPRTSTLLSIGLSAALVAAGILFLFNHHGDMWTRGPWTMPHGMMGGGMGFGMLLFGVVFLVALVVLLSAFMSGRRPASRDEALTILEKRYARGEIDKARFIAMRRDLRSKEVDDAR